MMKASVIEEYAGISGKAEDICFRQLLIDMGKLPEPFPEDGEKRAVYDLFIARCNILEALLLKAFSSAEGFEKLIMRDNDGKDSTQI